MDAPHQTHPPRASSLFDDIQFSVDESSSDDVSSEDDEIPLSKRIVTVKRKTVGELNGAKPIIVPEKPADSVATPRDIALDIFEREKQRLMAHEAVDPVQKRLLVPYALVFDGGTTRRGVCKYPSVRRGLQGRIGLSAAMVDGGASAECVTHVVRHEMAHACTPGHKHDSVWKAFHRLIGGDGQRCCTSAEVKAVIGHRIEVVCSKDPAHYCRKMQKRPSFKWLDARVCRTCKSAFRVVHVKR